MRHGRNRSPHRSGTASTPSRQQHLPIKGSPCSRNSPQMENAPRDFGKAITASCGGLLALYSIATGLGYYYRGGARGRVPAGRPRGQRVQDAGGSDAYFHAAVTYLVNNQPYQKNSMSCDGALSIKAGLWHCAGFASPWCCWPGLCSRERDPVVQRVPGLDGLVVGSADHVPVSGGVLCVRPAAG